MKSKKAPGRIFFRKMTNGIEYIYYTPYKSKERISTGLVKSKKNIEITEYLLEKYYIDYLNNQGKMSVKKEIPTLYQAFEEHHQWMRDRNYLQNTRTTLNNAFNHIFPNDYYITETRGNELRIENDLRTFPQRFPNFSNTTYNTQYRSVGKFLTNLSKWHNIKRISISEYFVAATHKEAETYTDEEIEIIREYLSQNDRNLLLWFDFMLLTGSRVSESLKLTWKNIDLIKEEISFTNKVMKGRKEVIPITNGLKQILEELYSQKEKNYYSDRVFGLHEGKRTALTHRIDRVQKALGIKKEFRGIHSIRKTFINKIIDNGINTYDAHFLFRHKDLNTTMGYYKKRDNGKQKQILENAIELVLK